jgi:hypothetical protein
VDAYYRVLSHVADQALDRIVGRVIRTVQGLKDGLLCGDDAGLTNTWDEICVQIQSGPSIYWELCDETVRPIVEGHLAALTRVELEAAWLVTDEGFEWAWDHKETVDPIPVCLEDVVDATMERLYARADDWSNERIRAFVERSFRTD